jgi:membrane-associated phospholipid phosphatase
MYANLELFWSLYRLTYQWQWFDKTVYFIAEYLDTVMIGIIVVALILFFVHDKDWKRRRYVVWLEEVLVIAMATTGTWLTAVTIKALTYFPRPFVTFPMVHPLVIETPYTSFPSGHAAVFFALAMSVYHYHKKLGYFFFFCATLISFARVIAGVHYPIDIIAGAVIGISMAHLSTIFFQKKK